MIVDKDKNGNISIVELTPAEAALLVEAICSLFVPKLLQVRTPEEREIILLKKELEKLY